MVSVKAYAAPRAKAPLAPFTIERREPRPDDVVIDISHCGVCHSDIHQARDEWGRGIFPMVPGHEIVGRVAQAGANVKGFKPGDTVGVGCFVDSCRVCGACKEGLQQYCETGMVATYNGMEKDGKTPTYGGYSTRIVVDQAYVLRIPPGIPLEAAAPLLCAGITTYSPLRHWGAGPGQKVAVIGLGGLGHMAVKLAAAMGAEVTVLSHSDKKKEDAFRLGAKHFHATARPETFKELANTFDLMLDTVSAPHDVSQYATLLRRDGTLVLLGIPDQAPDLQAFALINKRRRIAGSLIGGIPETQEMLDFCAEKGIGADVEVIPVDKINEAYERMIKGDVRYRFVIDTASLR